MQHHLNRRISLHQRHQPAGVIPVPVREHHHLDIFQPDSGLLKIVEQHRVAFSRVEQHILADHAGKAPCGLEPFDGALVFTNHLKFHGISFLSNPFSVFALTYYSNSRLTSKITGVLWSGQA